MTTDTSSAPILSVFTSGTAKGNPAAVVITPERLSFAERTRIGAEFGANTPATATTFISHPQILSPNADLTSPRPAISWTRFTGEPLPLCGHGTGAGVHYLLQTVQPSLHSVTFDYFFGDTAEDEVRKGTITGMKEGDMFGIDLPTALPGRKVTGAERSEVVDVFCKATGVKERDIVDMVASPSGYNGVGLNTNVTIELAASVDIAALKPDFDTLATIKPFRGIWVAAAWPQPNPPSAFRSRIFFPKTGLLEDQACGSAHTFIVPWWVERYRAQCEGMKDSKVPGRYRVPVDQVSPSGARMEIVWDGRWREEGGRCVLMGHGLVLDKM